MLIEEADTVWRLYLQDIVREAYIRDDGGVALILECADLQAAEREVGQLPLVANGLLEFELWAVAPFSPWARLHGPGSAMLSPG